MGHVVLGYIATQRWRETLRNYHIRNRENGALTTSAAYNTIL